MPARPLESSTLLNIVERTLPRVRRRRLLATGLSIAIFLIALGGRFALDHWVNQSLPFITFFAGVMLATLISGFWPGLLNLALSIAAAWYYFIPPLFTFGTDVASLATVAAFALQAAFLVFVGHVLNTVVERLSYERRRSEVLLERSARAETQLRDINGELGHRIKNVFGVIAGLLSQSSKYLPDSSALTASVNSRLRAMSAAQDLIVGNQLRGADLARLVDQTLQPLCPPGANRYTASGPAVFLNADTTTPLGLILHELATNSIKHGAWSNERGSVDLAWQTGFDDDGLSTVALEWLEKGGPPVSEPSRTGFGSVLIDRTLAGARIDRDFARDGLSCRIAFTMYPPPAERTGVPTTYTH